MRRVSSNVSNSCIYRLSFHKHCCDQLTALVIHNCDSFGFPNKLIGSTSIFVLFTWKHVRRKFKINLFIEKCFIYEGRTIGRQKIGRQKIGHRTIGRQTIGINLTVNDIINKAFKSSRQVFIDSTNWRFIDGLKAVQATRDKEYEEFVRDENRSQKRLKYREADDRISSIVEGGFGEGGQCTVLEYLRGLAQNFSMDQ